MHLVESPPTSAVEVGVLLVGAATTVQREVTARQLHSRQRGVGAWAIPDFRKLGVC